MHRVLAALVLFLLATHPGLAWPENGLPKHTQITVSVHNDARVPLGVLGRAEERAAKIFASADFEVEWVDCAPANSEDTLACTQMDGPGHLSVRIIADATNSLSAVAFGVAFLSPEGNGRYCDVFWKRAEDLHATSNVDRGSILGSVMAHEMGHLLLGSNAHAFSGIMRAHWESEELRRIAMGTLLFTPLQAGLMRAKARWVESAEVSRERASLTEWNILSSE